MKGITQKELAHRVGVDPGTLGRWERDESSPTGELKLRLEPFFREIL
jgi:transcriptional regulator with XRE-family HTH domain